MSTAYPSFVQNKLFSDTNSKLVSIGTKSWLECRYDFDTEWGILVEIEPETTTVVDSYRLIGAN